MTEQNKTTTIPLPVQGKDIDSIMQSLESGVEELFTSNRYQEFLKTMAKFHNYSFNNTMLIAMQRPDATLVTSYKNWQSMGRQVMKGEKGITIIAPAPYKKMKEKEVLDGLKCVGFDLKDGSDYEGMQSLMIEGKIQKDFLNSIPGFRENSYVQNAISRVEKYLEERHPNVENPLKSNKKVDNEKNISEEKNEKELNIQMKPIPKKKRGEMSL